MLGTLLVAGTLSALQWMILYHHPEPSPDEADASHKAAYRSLVSPLSVGYLGFASLVLTVALHTSGGLSWRMVIWSTTVLIWIWVDAKTTWLPIRCYWLILASTIGAITADAWGQPNRIWFGALAGGIAAHGLFAVLYWLTKSLGYGDVQLAGVLGAIAGSYGGNAWGLALLGGTTAAACYGLVVTWWRRHHPHPLGTIFAYGPGLWLGPYFLPAVWGWPAG